MGSPVLHSFPAAIPQTVVADAALCRPFHTIAQPHRDHSTVVALVRHVGSVLVRLPYLGLTKDIVSLIVAAMKSKEVFWQAI